MLVCYQQDFFSEQATFPGYSNGCLKQQRLDDDDLPAAKKQKVAEITRAVMEGAAQASGGNVTINLNFIWKGEMKGERTGQVEIEK